MADVAVPFLLTGFIDILTTTKTFVKNHKGFSADASAIRIRLEAGHHRVQCCMTFLFGQPPSRVGGIYTTLPEETKRIALGMIVQLFSRLKKYHEIEAKYGLTVQSTGPSESAATFDLEEFLRDVITGDTVMSDAVQNVQVGLDSTPWKKAKWAVSGKKRLEALVEGIEDWNGRIWRVIQDVVWTRILTVEQAERIAGSAEARELQFGPSARMRALILGGVLEEDQIVVVPPDVRKQAAIGARTSHTMKAGVVGGEAVLFEFKDYELDHSGKIDGDTEAQIRRLISLLRQQVDAGSRVLSCRHGYTDYAESRFVFMYDVPSGKLPQPITLSSVLEPSSPSLRNVRPSVTARLTLAHRLAESLYLLHTVGWVHKNLNGESILFFKPKGNPGDSTTTNIYDTPYIVGFEYSRPESDATSNREEWRIERNIYRHWERWGVPTARSSTIHDIYALGVLLLEIGIWKSARSTSRDGFKSHENDPLHVRDSLRKMLSGKMAFAMGEKYENIVRLCLEGSEKAFAVGTSDETDIILHKVFREKVVEVLKVLSETV